LTQEGKTCATITYFGNRYAKKMMWKNHKDSDLKTHDKRYNLDSNEAKCSILILRRSLKVTLIKRRNCFVLDCEVNYLAQFNKNRCYEASTTQAELKDF
jgi:hypothetical protein